MEHSAIAVIVKQTIKKINFKSVTDDELLMESGILDSVSLIDLSVTLEEAFSIQIPLVDINKQHFKNVESIANYIAFKLQ